MRIISATVILFQFFIIPKGESGRQYSVLFKFDLFHLIFPANNLHVSDGASTAEIIGGDIFFEIIEPTELEYTYRLRPAKDFGAAFVSGKTIKMHFAIAIDFVE